VQAFARDGAHIGLIARGRERLDATRAEVERLGGKALVIQGDVAGANTAERAADAVEKAFGPIDIWINNAMSSVFSPVSQMEPEEFRRVTEVTYLGFVYGTLAALKRMLPRNRGVIVQVGSALTHISIPLQSAYCGAKHAMLGFTISLRTELLHDRSNVRVSIVQMPAMNTPQFDWVKSRLPNRAQPVPPIFQPEACASAVVYAARNDVGRELLVGWPTVKAVLGDKLVPWYVDRKVAKDLYRDQQTDEPEVPNRPNNLLDPVPGAWGAHGRFDDVAKRYSVELWLRLNRGWIVGAIAAILVVLVVVIARA
jgi:short-subunit dehydrogenase